MRLPAEQRRTQLLEVAIEIFAERGFHATSMDDIAEAAGVTKPVLYQHFPSKRALYRELLDDVDQQLTERLVVATAGATSGRERVQEGFAAYFRFVAAHRASFRLLFGASVRNDPEFAAVAEATIDRVAELIAELIDIDAVSDHRRTLAHAMVGMAEATSRRVVNDEGEDDPDRLAGWLAEMAWFGLRGVRADELGAGLSVPSLGPLIPADESFHHQITDTFATVAQSDRSWTEKVCAMACARDGSLQLAFGIGKYANRNVMDAYAGVSRGVEQWTVRASRELGRTPDVTVAGPIAYEVLEPLEAVRFALAQNDVVPISFEWTFRAAVPPALEQREHHRSRDGFRLDADIVRYHQSGTGSGWAEVDGVRTELTDWVSTRDHSWGVRYQVGTPPADVAPATVPEGVHTLVLWCPVVCRRADGSEYALHWYFQRHGIGDWSRIEMQGGVEHPDGRREPFVALVPDLAFRDDNRRFEGGTLTMTMADGSTRPLTLTRVSDTGFHLGTGLYHGFDGMSHGQWRGRLHVDGEHFADCSDPAIARRVHQHRDCVIRVDDPVGGGIGIGNLQSIVMGADAAMQLTDDASFL